MALHPRGLVPGRLEQQGHGGFHSQVASILFVLIIQVVSIIFFFFDIDVEMIHGEGGPTGCVVGLEKWLVQLESKLERQVEQTDPIT